jgi:hypothetical protein
MTRKQEYIVGGALLGAASLGAYELYKQYQYQNHTITWNTINWKQLFIESAKGAVVGAGVGYVVHNFTKPPVIELPLNKNKYLRDVLNANALDFKSDAIQEALSMRQCLHDFAICKYGNKFAGKPIFSGSVASKTANSTADFDIVLPFSKSEFLTIGDMYEDVFTTFSELAASNESMSIRRQPRSIGITYCMSDDYEFHFDIVPAREVNNYHLNGDLHLYNKPRGLNTKQTYIKTNIEIHKAELKNRPAERSVIRLLKLYRDEMGFQLGSKIISQFVVEAFDSTCNPSKSLSSNLLCAMEHIADKMSYRTRLIDKANTNNNLLAKLSESEQLNISEILYADATKLRYDNEYLRTIFG